jgi:hypothetical protein
MSPGAPHGARADREPGQPLRHDAAEPALLRVICDGAHAHLWLHSPDGSVT